MNPPLVVSALCLPSEDRHADRFTVVGKTEPTKGHTVGLEPILLKAIIKLRGKGESMCRLLFMTSAN